MRILDAIKSQFVARHSPPATRHSSLTTRALYDRWAPLYPPLPHNPIMRAEQSAMLQLLPQVRGLRALDLACGSGRYAALLRERGAAFVAGLDFSPVMLMQAQVAGRVCASMMALPLADASFELVVSGLAVGHADELQGWLSEAARVLRPGGRLLYSDFHPAAAQSGLKRSFRGEDGRTYTLPHQDFALSEHLALAPIAGLSVESVTEVRAGIELTESFEGSDAFYRKWHGTPLVLVVAMRKL
jgi:malonyl-CoA O-methyltransferase